MATTINWEKEIQSLLKKYKTAPHPLTYNTIYELLVKVVLSAQDSDKNINKIGPELFAAFPDMKALSKATEEILIPLIRQVRNFDNKAKWLIAIAHQIKEDKNISITMEGLTALSGIGRKSANVIRREAGEKPEGLIVDLHVVRVAPRLGISKNIKPEKIEKDLMQILPQKDWDAGMALSFLGREICRPTNPNCAECPMNKVCEYCKKIGI
jgi:endonuclease-3